MKVLLVILGFIADNVQAYLLLRLREVVLCLETWHTFPSLKDAHYVFFFHTAVKFNGLFSAKNLARITISQENIMLGSGKVFSWFCFRTWVLE